MILGLLVVTYVAWQNYQVAVHAGQYLRLEEEALVTRGHILGLGSNAKISAAVALDFVLSGEEDYLVKFHSTINVEKEHWQALQRRGTVLFDQGDLVDILRTRIDNSQAFSKRLVQLRQDATLAEVQSVMESGEGQTLLNAIDSAIELLDESLLLKLQERRTKAIAENVQWGWYAKLIAIMSVGTFVVLFGVYIHKSPQNDIWIKKVMESEQRMRLATSAAGIAVWDWNLEDDTLQWDERMYQQYGLSPKPGGAAPTIQDWRARVLPADLAMTEATLQQAVDIVGRSEREFRIVRASDQAVRTIQAAEMALAGDDGKTTRVVGVNIDITERKLADAKIQNLNLELKQISKYKDEFLANISHELRTPLNAILGLSEILLEQTSGVLTPRQNRSITTIFASGKHLLQVINDILDLSKIEAGAVEINLEVVNLREICESALVLVKTQATKKNLDLATRIDAVGGACSADPRWLKQILINLLSNAVKFTPEGGRIELNVTGTEEDEEVSFIVSDTGPGISPEEQKRLFRPFNQGDSSTTRKHEGTGLGLALVARLVDLHGGSVALESELGHGSRFIVALPQANRSVAPKPTPSPDGPSRKGHHRVLVIEDDPVAGEILVDQLNEMNFNVALHPSALLAHEVVLREKPDVIFLDILLPDGDGWSVLSRLKVDSATRDIPVATISIVDDPVKSKSLGAVAHFTKPITREKLADFFQRNQIPRLYATALPILPFSPPGQGPIVLLAEDNPSNAETLGDYLQDKGYTMRYAVNGVEAVSKAQECQPAIILMDIQMPVMDGLTAMREIRSDPALRSIPMVALTALAMPGDRDRCIEAGATDYMSKPLKLKRVAELMANLLRSSPLASSILPPDHV